MFRSARLPVALLGLLLLPLAGCSSGSTKASVGAPSVPAASSASSSAAVAATGSQIVIDNFKFAPSTLTVSPGQKVTVVNKDSTTHTLTAKTGNAFDTGDIASGASATFTAPTKAGTYPYICTIHQFMTGTLTVK